MVLHIGDILYNSDLDLYALIVRITNSIDIYVGDGVPYSTIIFEPISVQGWSSIQNDERRLEQFGGLREIQIKELIQTKNLGRWQKLLLTSSGRSKLDLWGDAILGLYYFQKAIPNRVVSLNELKPSYFKELYERFLIAGHILNKWDSFINNDNVQLESPILEKDDDLYFRDDYSQNGKLFPSRLSKGLQGLQRPPSKSEWKVWKSESSNFLTYYHPIDGEKSWTFDSPTIDPTDDDQLLASTGFFSPIEWLTLTSYRGSQLHRYLFMLSIGDYHVVQETTAAIPDIRPQRLAGPQMNSNRTSNTRQSPFQPYFPYHRTDSIPIFKESLENYMLDSPYHETGDRVVSVMKQRWSDWEFLTLELPVCNPYLFYANGQDSLFLLETRVDFIGKTQDKVIVGDYKTMIGKTHPRYKLGRSKDWNQIFINAFLVQQMYGVKVTDVTIIYTNPQKEVWIYEVPFSPSNPYVQVVLNQFLMPLRGGLWVDDYCILPFNEQEGGRWTLPPGLPGCKLHSFMRGESSSIDSPTLDWEKGASETVGSFNTHVFAWKYEKNIVYTWKDWARDGAVTLDSTEQLNSNPLMGHGQLWRTSIPPRRQPRVYAIDEPIQSKQKRKELFDNVERMIKRIVFKDRLTSRFERGEFMEMAPSELQKLLMDNNLGEPTTKGPRLETELTTDKRSTRHQWLELNCGILRRTYHRAINQCLVERFPKLLETHPDFVHTSQRSYWSHEQLHIALYRDLLKVDLKVRSILLNNSMTTRI